jgi:hypothetical protein
MTKPAGEWRDDCTQGNYTLSSWVPRFAAVDCMYTHTHTHTHLVTCSSMIQRIQRALIRGRGPYRYRRTFLGSFRLRQSNIKDRAYTGPRLHACTHAQCPRTAGVLLHGCDWTCRRIGLCPCVPSVHVGPHLDDYIETSVHMHPKLTYIGICIFLNCAVRNLHSTLNEWIHDTIYACMTQIFARPEPNLYIAYILLAIVAEVQRMHQLILYVS